MVGRKPTVSDEEILHVLFESTDPFLTTTEIAEEIGLSQPGTPKRLRGLEGKDMWRIKKQGIAILGGLLVMGIVLMVISENFISQV